MEFHHMLRSAASEYRAERNYHHNRVILRLSLSRVLPLPSGFFYCSPQLQIMYTYFGQPLHTFRTKRRTIQQAKSVSLVELYDLYLHIHLDRS